MVVIFTVSIITIITICSDFCGGEVHTTRSDSVRLGATCLNASFFDQRKHMTDLRALFRKLLKLLLLALLCLQSALAAEWSVQIDERTGLPKVGRGGTAAIEPGMVFWGANWAWADVQSSVKVLAPYRYAFAGKVKTLDVDFAGEIQKKTDNQLVWDLRFDARSALNDVIGGGMVFKFDLANFAAEMGEPELLPDNRGWAWGKANQRIEMRFEPALATVYFERGNKSEVRAFFYSKSISPGKQNYTATLTLGSDVAIGPTHSERFGMADPTRWPTDSLNWKTSPVDLAFLNAAEKPAGKRGFIKSQGDKLAFADNSPARFWGTNLTAYTLFGSPKEAVKEQAQRLSALGFNLVRIHHHDSYWVSPNIFGEGKFVKDTQRINAQMQDKIDWWIKCLKDEGIYVWLDLHVQRAFKPGDNIYGFAEISKGKDQADLKGYNYVNITIQQAMKRFSEAYVTHVNPHTGLAYKDEPAIAAMLITNENDITHHFGNSLLPDKKVPDHHKLYKSEADAFARAHNLPADKVWRSWEHGPSKIFLSDLERRFDVEMIAHLRGLGVKVPIATTNTWGNNPLSSLPALTSGDVIDVHSYGGLGQLEKSPFFTAGLVHWIGAGQVAGKPLTVTEWNAEPFPTPDRHTLPLYVAGAASHQGWDALMQYAYSQEPFRGSGSPSNWHSYNDPGLLATLPAAALAYRRGDVKEATTTYVFDPGMALYNQPISAANSPALRTAMEKGKLLIAMPATKELPWLERSAIPANTKVLRDPAQAVIDAKATEATTDTGELTRNWTKGIYTINTARTQAAMGWIGGETIALADVEIKAKTRNATVAVQSLENAPIAQAKRLLISLGARALPKEGNKTPFNVEPVDGQLTIRAPKGLKLYKQAAFQQMKEVPVGYKDGRYVVTLDGSLRTSWLFLR
jgi:hypothetical protein